jgi:murein DD-endopeptidase MepM/ murein hydrolase activator NlpD
MIKNKVIFLSVLIFATHLVANIDNKIKLTKEEIENTKSKTYKLSKKLEKIAAEIEIEKVNASKIINDIQKCKEEISNHKNKSTIKTKELIKIQKLYKSLTKRERQVSKKVINILSKEITIQMLMQSNSATNKPTIYENDVDSVIMNEIFETYGKILREKFHKTKSKYIRLNKNILLIKNELNKIDQKINFLKDKKQILADLRKERTKTIESMDKKQKLYRKKLIKMQKEKNSLSRTLSKLNITKKTQEEKRRLAEQARIIAEQERRIAEQERKAAKLAQEAAQAKKAHAQQEREKTKITANDSNINVRKIGSSYQHTKVVKYKGKKTISPIKGYKVVQKFGNFNDPVYNIKIFNDSVILKSNSSNAKVRSVLDGTIVYANATSMLDNVIIIKHAHNLHTIYAHVDRIAPTIKVGKKITKGYVIGRVRKELTFEVTKNENHINPMDLIK